MIYIRLDLPHFGDKINLNWILLMWLDSWQVWEAIILNVRKKIEWSFIEYYYCLAPGNLTSFFD